MGIRDEDSLEIEVCQCTRPTNYVIEACRVGNHDTMYPLISDHLEREGNLTSHSKTFAILLLFIIIQIIKAIF